MITKPIITEALLDYLDSLYPDKCPEPKWTDREIWIRRGEAGVVRHLRSLHQEQSKNILGDSNNVLRQ